MSKGKDQVAAGCCGPIADRVGLIKRVASSLHDGHMGIASMYESIAKDMTTKKEKKQFIDAAEEHRKMAEASRHVIVPDEVEDA